jgi:hypothetical protein
MTERTKEVSSNLVREIIWADAKEVLKYFMQDPAVKHAYVKMLIDDGLTVKQIREFVNISPNHISEIRHKDASTLQNALIETLRNKEISKLYMIGAKILGKLDSDAVLDKMKGGELAYAFKVLLDSRRLLENKSTANISVQVSALNQRFDQDAQQITKLLGGIARKKPDVIEAVAEEGGDAAA